MRGRRWSQRRRRWSDDAGVRRLQQLHRLLLLVVKRNVLCRLPHLLVLFGLSVVHRLTYRLVLARCRRRLPPVAQCRPGRHVVKIRVVVAGGICRQNCREMNTTATESTHTDHHCQPPPHFIHALLESQRTGRVVRVGSSGPALWRRVGARVRVHVGPFAVAVDDQEAVDAVHADAVELLPALDRAVHDIVAALAQQLVDTTNDTDTTREPYTTA